MKLKPKSEEIPKRLIPSTEMSNEAYHAHPALSRSSLWTLKNSPEDYYYKYLSGEYHPERKRELWFGSLFHEYVLERPLFDSKYAVVPKVDKRTKEWKEIVKKYPNTSFAKEDEGETFIYESDLETIKQMHAAFNKNQYATNFFKSHGINEASFFWTNEEFGVDLKCRPDRYINGNLVLDLKTASSAHPNDFIYSCKKYGHHLSAAMTLTGIEAVTGKRPQEYMFLVVEKTPPFKICVFRPTRAFIDWGMVELNNLLEKFFDFRRRNEWPGYCEANEYVTLDIPEYIRRDYDI